MSEPLVSIITPTWRRADAHVLSRMLASVHAQTYAHWEHLVASDGEVEELPRALCGQLGPPGRTRYLVTSMHHGGYGAGVRQEVLTAEARGDLVCFLDDDDLILPEYLDTMVAALDSDRGAGFAICGLLHLAGRGPRLLGHLRGAPVVGRIGTPQVLVRTALMRQVGWQRRDRYEADGHTYQALAEAAPFVQVDRCLCIAL